MNNTEQISPPHSISAEQAVLGGLMLDNDRWDDIATIVSADRFYSRPHGVIFSAMQTLLLQNKPIDLITLTESMEQQGTRQYHRSGSAEDAEMNESASFMEIPEMKESVRPVRSKLWAIVRYGLGGLVLFALGGITFISLKQVQLLSGEVSQLKTALQGSPDIAPLQAQLTTLQQQFEASQMQLEGMADKPAFAALQQKIEALDKQQREQTTSEAVLKTELSYLQEQVRASNQRPDNVATVVPSVTPDAVAVKKKPTQKTQRPVTAPFVLTGKGDADLLKRMYAESHRAGRAGEFHVFHLGWPDISARYNAVGRFGRISEVASRVAGQLSSEGNSAAFKEFAWRFVNIIARALVALGQRPDFGLIQCYVNNIGDLFETYAETWMVKHTPALWQQVENLTQILDERDIPRHMEGRSLRVVAIEQVLNSDEGKKVYDPVLDGLRSSVRYDQKYYDKIVASLLPLLEKLTSGKTAQLISPNYTDMSDPRPIFDWQQVIRKKGVVYIGLDALSDPEVAAAVGNSMFADLVSVAGHIYKFGVNDGLPGEEGKKTSISLHCDEFNELMGDEFIPLINKGGGAGIEVTAYTQTLPDIEARLGNAAKAAQVVGNFNSLVMLRVRHTETAELMTRQLPEVEVYTKTLVSGVTDISNPEMGSDFTSNTQDRVSTVRTPLITAANVINLPKGQAFALLEGGRLWKIRMPLPAAGADALMPDSIGQIADYMQRNYRTSDAWWSGSALPGDYDAATF